MADNYKKKAKKYEGGELDHEKMEKLRDKKERTDRKLEKTAEGFARVCALLHKSISFDLTSVKTFLGL